MAVTVLLLCILLLILFTAWLKINPFLSFLAVSIVAGLLLGLKPEVIFQSFQKGMGDTIGALVTIVCLGAMLGKLIAESGAAQQIAQALSRAFGVRYIQWALLCTGFIVGSTLFYGIGFVLLTPLIFSVVYQYKLPAVYIGLPALAALSVAHGYLPPHPAPTALVIQLKASIGLTLLYGLVIAVPAILVAGPLFARTTKNWVTASLPAFQPKPMAPENMPGSFASFCSALLPVLLLLVATPLSFVSFKNRTLQTIIQLFSNPTMALLLALISATYFLGIRMHKNMKTVMKIYESGIRDISTILLIIGGAGALKQLFVEAGIDKVIAHTLQQVRLEPLVLGWLVAAVIRIALGSSTVAGLMTAGIIQPVMIQKGVDPNLMVLSIGAGSMICSHVNDSGFWLFKEYFNLTLKQTFLSFTIMESLVALMGLLGVLALNSVL